MLKKLGIQIALSGKLSYTIATPKYLNGTRQQKFWQETWFRDPSFRFDESFQICTTHTDDISTDRSSVGCTMVYQDEKNYQIATWPAFTATNDSTSLCHLFLHQLLKIIRPSGRTHSPCSLYVQGAVIAENPWVEINAPPGTEQTSGATLSHRCVVQRSLRKGTLEEFGWNMS